LLIEGAKLIEGTAPLVVGIGGTTVSGSSTERALKIALSGAEAAGMRTRLFGGEILARLPLYTPKMQDRTVEEHDFVAAIREASGVIFASPGYHGSVSGLVKNAIDLIEETAQDARVYLDDLPVGVVVTAYGWAATGSTIAAMRSIVHALRGWPTPFAAAINSSTCRFDEHGGCSDAAVVSQLTRVGEQVARGIRLRLSA
jgi:FMN reductase